MHKFLQQAFECGYRWPIVLHTFLVVPAQAGTHKPGIRAGGLWVNAGPPRPARGRRGRHVHDQAIDARPQTAVAKI